MKTRGYFILSLLIFALGAGLRLPHLATRSLWFDEAVAANVADTRTENSSPILYPLLLHAVEKVGHTAAMVRAPSYACSVMLILLVLVLGRRLLGDRAALLAALLLAITPSQIHFAQEVREYACSALVAALMTFACLNYLSHPSGRPQRALSLPHCGG